MTKIDMLRDIVENGYRKIRVDGKKVLVDAFTASAIVQVYDALNDENKKKFINLPLTKMSDFAFKHCGLSK